MKILAYRHDNDFGFDRILHALAKTKYNIGYASGEIKEENIKEFNPDIIIHNIPDTESFPIKNSAISININEANSKNSFSLKNPNAINYIEPFISIKKTEIPESDKIKYSSDVMFIGSPTVFGSIINFINDPQNKILFKFFSRMPHNICGYCGFCPPEDYYQLYANSKVSLVTEEDKARIMDIVVSDGNPVIFDGKNTDECINKIKDAIVNNARYKVEGFMKDDILNRHTAFDRASQIFKTIGLKKISDDILKEKVRNR